jgi:hypothetical protein
LIIRLRKQFRPMPGHRPGHHLLAPGSAPRHLRVPGERVPAPDQGRPGHTGAEETPEKLLQVPSRLAQRVLAIGQIVDRTRQDMRCVRLEKLSDRAHGEV